MTISKKNYLAYFITLATFVVYFLFSYTLERTEFYTFLGYYFVLFSSYYYLLEKANFSFKTLLGFAVLFRILLLFSTPNLSQDFYRFIWDGRMIFEGLNPYLSLPEHFINQSAFPIKQAAELYAGMGELNGSNFTNYPPINQFLFFISALLTNETILGSIVVMRFQIILAEVGIIIIGKKLLQTINLPVKKIFLYALNPFIIIELTGNLHYEPVMLFFFLLSIYFLVKNKNVWAAIALACSISVKLIPLLFLPIFYQWFVKKNKSTLIGLRKLIKFYGLILFTTAVLFLPFYSNEFINNYSKSIGLWFSKFEFNASIYYVFREIGYGFRGYNEIAIIGKITPVLTILFLGVITFLRKNTSIKDLFTAMLFGLSFYYFTTTTMHPWYLATLILISLFTKYRFPIVWSAVIILSYSAYSNDPYKENLYLISLEYFIVYGYLLFELYQKSKRQIF